jgi:hypothetical protein
MIGRMKRAAGLLAAGLLAAGLLAPAATRAAESPAQLLRYMRDLAGTSCSAGDLALRAAPGGEITEVLRAPAYVTVLGGEIDGGGRAWAQVTDDQGGATGWVDLDELSCI